MSIQTDVIAIQDGACNPRAMARALVKTIDDACDNGNGHPAAGNSPEVRLILHQLLFILYGVDCYMHDADNAVLRNGRGGPQADWDLDMKAVKDKLANA